MKGTTTCIGAMVLFIALLIYGIMVGGFLILEYWKWFGHVAFPTVNYTMTLTQAIAVSFLLTPLRGYSVSDLKDECRDNSKKYSGLLVPWMTILFGYFAHLFIK